MPRATCVDDSIRNLTAKAMVVSGLGVKDCLASRAAQAVWEIWKGQPGVKTRFGNLGDMEGTAWHVTYCTWAALACGHQPCLRCLPCTVCPPPPIFKCTKGLGGCACLCCRRCAHRSPCCLRLRQVHISFHCSHHMHAHRPSPLTRKALAPGEVLVSEACALYCVACSGHMPELNFCQRQIVAGESILQGLCRWSRLAKRCTQARHPRPAGAALCLFLHPACVIWCLVCLWWCVGNAGRRELGGGRGVPTRACLRHLGPAGRSAPTRNRPSLRSAPRTPHCARQASTSTMVCGRGAERWQTPT